jgi:hypothetical protein
MTAQVGVPGLIATTLDGYVDQRAGGELQRSSTGEEDGGVALDPTVGGQGTRACPEHVRRSRRQNRDDGRSRRRPPRTPRRDRRSRPRDRPRPTRDRVDDASRWPRGAARGRLVRRLLRQLRRRPPCVRVPGPDPRRLHRLHRDPAGRQPTARPRGARPAGGEAGLERAARRGRSPMRQLPLRATVGRDLALSCGEGGRNQDERCHRSLRWNTS